MKPIFFQFRDGLAPAERAAALERIRALPAVQAAGEMFPGAREGSSAGAMVASVGDAYRSEDVLATLREMEEIAEVSAPAARELIG